MLALKSDPPDHKWIELRSELEGKPGALRRDAEYCEV
jgi:hypothetical protein